MLNHRLLQEVVSIVREYNAENAKIKETSEAIYERALYWYEHTDYTDPITLAALTLTGETATLSNYYTNQNITHIVERYFKEDDELRYIFKM